MYGMVFDIDHFAVHDGPGIRTTVYLKGCPLRCVWCHSPESQTMEAELLFTETRCIGCAKCFSACGSGALVRTEGGGRSYRRTLCIRCGRCAAACPAGAVTLCGKEMDADAVVAEVSQNIAFFRNSGGGVTLTGGEVLAQAEFSAEILGLLKDRGIDTIVETSGMGRREDLDLLFPYVDTFYYDLKIIDPDLHIRSCGSDNRKILENLEHLRNHTEKIVVRVPLIPGYTDSVENVSEIYETAIKYDIRKVHLLPYNESASAKYSWLGRTFMPGALSRQTKEYLDGLVNIGPGFIDISVV